MRVAHVEVLVEEPSMEAALRLLLPSMLGPVTFTVYPHQCKEELLARLPQRLQGYRRWLPADCRIVVVVDRDNDDCLVLKDRLETMVQQAGLTTRSDSRHQQHYQVVNRLAIEELEAWYFGDWQAVRSAYPRVSTQIPQKMRYRDPDAILGGTWEALERVLKKKGYFTSGLRKIEAARRIAPHMNPDANKSKSFQVFRDVIREMVPA